MVSVSLPLWSWLRSATEVFQANELLGSGMIRRMFLTHPVLSLVVLCAALTVPFYGSRGLFETSEGRYCECARQMLEFGSYWTPVLNGQPHLTKPPLTYWAIMAGIRLLGTNAWAARAYLIVSFTLTTVFVYLLARELFGRRTAVLAGIVFASAPYTIAAAQVITADLLVTCWIAMAMWAFWRALRTGQSIYVVGLWAALALGIFTKGPVGLLPLFGGMLPVYLLARYLARTTSDTVEVSQLSWAFFPRSYLRKYTTLQTPAIFNVVGLALFFSVGLTWFLTQEEGSLFVIDWISHEVIGRIFYGEFDRHPEFSYALTVYMPLLSFGMGPWWIFVAHRYKTFLPRYYDHLKHAGWLADPVWLYLWLSVAVPGAIFFLSKSKLPLYVLPLAIPISIIWGRHLRGLLQKRYVTWNTVVVILLIHVLGSAALRCVLSYGYFAADMKPLASAVRAFQDDHPGAILCALDRPLNGLQFALQRQLPVVSSAEVVRGLARRQFESPTVWLLARTSQLKRWRETQNLSVPYTPLTYYWVLIPWRLQLDDLIPVQASVDLSKRLHAGQARRS